LKHRKSCLKSSTQERVQFARRCLKIDLPFVLIKDIAEKTFASHVLTAAKTFARRDDLVKHVKKFHSEVVKRKAEENGELDRLELLHSNKIPRMSIDHQIGGGVSTRGTKRVSEEEGNTDVKVAKINEDKPGKSDNLEESALFQANMDKMGKPKSWKRGKVIDQKFTFTLEQRRETKPDEDLGVEAVYALVEVMDAMIEEMEIDPAKYDLAFQIGSKEHYPG